MQLREAPGWNRSVAQTSPLDMMQQVLAIQTMKQNLDLTKQKMALEEAGSQRQAETHYRTEREAGEAEKTRQVGEAVQTITGQAPTPELFPLFGKSLEAYKTNKPTPDYRGETKLGTPETGLLVMDRPTNMEDVKRQVSKNYEAYKGKAGDVARTYGPTGAPEIEGVVKRGELTGTPAFGSANMAKEIQTNLGTYQAAEEGQKKRELAPIEVASARSQAQYQQAHADLAQDQVNRLPYAHKLQELSIAFHTLANENSNLDAQLKKINLKTADQKNQLELKALQTQIGLNNQHIVALQDAKKQRDQFEAAKGVYNAQPTDENFRKVMSSAGLEGFQSLGLDKRAALGLAEKYYDDVWQNRSRGYKALVVDKDPVAAQDFMDASNLAQMRYAQHVNQITPGAMPMINWNSVYTTSGMLGFGTQSKVGTTQVPVDIANAYVTGKLRPDTPQNLAWLTRMEAAGLKDDPGSMPAAIDATAKKYQAMPDVVLQTKQLFEAANKIPGQPKVDRQSAEQVGPFLSVPEAKPKRTPNQERLFKKSQESSAESEATPGIGNMGTSTLRGANIPQTPQNVSRYKALRGQGLTEAQAIRQLRGEQ